MDTVEKIARDLAAVLSPAGEHAWPEFVPLAVEVKGRLDRQFDTLMSADVQPEVSAETAARHYPERSPVRRN